VGVLAEELGFIGGMVVLILFALLLWRLLACSWRSNGPVRHVHRLWNGDHDLLPGIRERGHGHGARPGDGHPAAFITYGGASMVSLAAGLRLYSEYEPASRETRVVAEAVRGSRGTLI